MRGPKWTHKEFKNKLVDFERSYVLSLMFNNERIEKFNPPADITFKCPKINNLVNK